MRTSKFTPEQMVHILRQGDSGVPVVELCRQHGISEQTYYRWKKRFGDLGTAEVRPGHTGAHSTLHFRQTHRGRVGQLVEKGSASHPSS